MADRECEALLRIGLVSATLERRNSLLKLAESRAAANPGNAGYQRDLSISRHKLRSLDQAGAEDSA